MNPYDEASARNLDPDPLLRAVCTHWLTKLDKARKHKEKVFQLDADECMRFFNGPRDWEELMGDSLGGSKENLPETTFRMSVNKAFELVTIFGPALYYQTPVRTVNPRRAMQLPPEIFGNPQVGMALAQQELVREQADAVRATVLEGYLDWTARNNCLDLESRQAIEEALVKGRGCLWTELRTPPGSTMRIAASEFGSVDDLFVDPDAKSFEAATWIARRCVHPVWQVERDYGIEPGTLKGNMESQAMQAEVSGDEDGEFDRKRGLTNDLLVYWKIYSKMGIGGRLSGIDRDFRGPLELFGDNVFLVVARDVPFPLNVPPSVQHATASGPGLPGEVFDRVAWPTPFWADRGWPVSVLDFHRVPNSPWPMSHLKAGLGEIKFLNWMTSFIAGKIRNTCRDFIAVAKDLGEEIKTSLLHGTDMELLEIERDHGTVSELITYLQSPQMNGDIWKVIAAVEQNFDRRVGLTDLMYGEGGGTQIRSAQEASVRNQNANVRPEDMARQVEAWMSVVASKEATVARFHLSAADIRPVLGDMAGMAWDQYVATQDMAASRGLEYTIESGSARRKNKDAQVQQSTESVQTLLPVLQGYAQSTGDLSPINNLLADWAKARDLDPARYQMTQAIPPPPPQAESTPPPEK